MAVTITIPARVAKVLETLAIVIISLPAAIPTVDAIFHFGAAQSAEISSIVGGAVVVAHIVKELLAKPAIVVGKFLHLSQ